MLVVLSSIEINGDPGHTKKLFSCIHPRRLCDIEFRTVSVQSEGDGLMSLDRETGIGLAPDALGARMSLELNMLDAVSENLLQVSNAERTRAVAMAQQETVALAQIMKVCVLLLALL